MSDEANVWRPQLVGTTYAEFIDVKDDAGHYTNINVETVLDEIAETRPRVVNSILALISTPTSEPAFVTGFYSGTYYGDGNYTWSAATNKNTANGGTIIDPATIGGFDGTTATLAAYLAAQGTGVGLGCWVLSFDGVYDPSVFGFSASSSAASNTSALEAMNAAMGNNGSKAIIPPGGPYDINATDFPITRKTIIAYGSKFNLKVDGVAFDLNPDADPNNVETSSKSYGYWYGGEFTSDVVTPTATTAFKCYAIRQMRIEDTIIGDSTTVTMIRGIQIGGLGGHLMEKNRFLKVGSCFYCPDWSGGATSAGIPITTSSFFNNEFILDSGQQAFYVNGGFNRWKIWGGFVNGSVGANIFHFTNNKDASQLNITGVGMEQGAATSKFFYFQDVGGTTMSLLKFDSINFAGDPAGGSLNAVELEKCQYVKFTNCRFEQNSATSNYSIVLDANCTEIEIDRATRFSYSNSMSIACARKELTIQPNREILSGLNLSGYNGDAKSSSTVTLDMSVLMGGDFPNHPPLGYTLIVQARDSASAASTTTAVEVMQSTGALATKRAMVDLRGVPNDLRVGETIDVIADVNGDIALQIYASGAGTLDIWVYVIAVHN